MAKCDICNRVDGARTPLSSDNLRKAVASGFNPYEEGLAARNPIGGGFGAFMQSFAVSEEELFSDWKQKLAVDTTDWNLCDGCHTAVSQYL